MAVAGRGEQPVTFPSEPPSDLDDPAVIRAHDWQAFRAVEHMQNHWDRPGWTDARRSYHWMLSFHDALAVRQLAAQCQHHLDLPGIDLVPLDALHLTIGRAGFTDEIKVSTVRHLVEIARSSCAELTAFDLSVGPLTGSRGALRFSVAPWSPLLNLHRALSAATQDVLGTAERLQTEYFRPHLSIAYTHKPVAVAGLIPRLVELRAIPPIVATIEAASLVELRRENQSYRYDELARLKFAEP